MDMQTSETSADDAWQRSLGRSAFLRGAAKLATAATALSLDAEGLSVGPLAEAEIQLALSRGLARAQQLAKQNLIRAAALHLQGTTALTSNSTGRPDYCPIGSPV